MEAVFISSNKESPVPPYESLRDVLLGMDNQEHAMIFTTKYLTGCRLNEWPMSFQKGVSEETGSKVVWVTTNLLKNPTRKTKRIAISITAEPKLVSYMRDWKDYWKDWKKRRAEWNKRNFWYTGRVLQKWYKENLEQEYPGTSPHFLRHCRATHFVTEWRKLGLKAAPSISQLMGYFGWSRLASAQTYFRLGEMDII